MPREYPYELTNPFASASRLSRQARGIMGDRVKAIVAGPNGVTMVVKDPPDPQDGATTYNIVSGATTIPLTATPSVPEMGDNVSIQIGEATGDYTWTWTLNGQVIDDSDTSGVATVGDYTIDAASIESGTHEIEVRKAGMYGYIKLEVQ